MCANTSVSRPTTGTYTPSVDSVMSGLRGGDWRHHGAIRHGVEDVVRLGRLTTGVTHYSILWQRILGATYLSMKFKKSKTYHERRPTAALAACECING